MLPKITLFLLCFLVFLSGFDQALAGKRVALVIGNGDYVNAPLKNPVNDATDMAKVLTTLNFEVIHKINADKRTMEDAMDQFYRKLQQAEVGLFYFAGHGMQLDGINYLIPVGARMANAKDVKWVAVPAGQLIDKIDDAESKLNVVILDACRNNPFPRSSRSSQNGLAFMSAPDATIVAYATAPGSIAMDGTGRNGVYTSHLLKNLNRSDLPILQLFNRTGLDVKQATNGSQTPWMTNSPMETYYLAGGSGSNTWTDPVTGMEFVRVAGGCYQMGQTEKEKEQLIADRGQEEYNDYYQDELPRHEVCVDDFWMGNYEVTVGQWRQFIRSTSYITDAEKDTDNKGCYVYKSGEWGWQDGYDWKNPGFSQSDQQPVACVSYNDVTAFINWLNRKGARKFRLSSEAEWEYAARGGSSTIRFWGDDVDSQACTYANGADKGNWLDGFPCDDDYKFTAPVGSFRPNDFGLYDMLGNVWEWCADWYDDDYYTSSSRHNPQGASSGSYRVLRGGGWYSFPRGVRAADRGWRRPGFRSSSLGFRLVLSEGSR